MKQSTTLRRRAKETSDVIAKSNAVQAQNENLSPQRMIVLAIMAALCVRCAVSLHPYSGENNPPMHGDFEAQRHWMELTLHLPPKLWYTNSTTNNLQYWGIDYPPLSAYHSYLTGKPLQYLYPKAFELLTSHGYESPYLKTLMRTSVILCDLLFYIPPLLGLITSLYNPNTTSSIKTITTALLCPAMILIDHGHFQYNNISIGLFYGSLYFFLHQYDTIAIMLFCCALYFKQMTLYFAPIIATYILSQLLSRKTNKEKIMYVLSMGGSAVLTSVLIFWPYLSSKNDFLQVVHRIFPIGRGIYEDKVANFWCTLSIVTKVHKKLTRDWQVLVCLVFTVVGCLPFCGMLFWGRLRKRKGGKWDKEKMRLVLISLTGSALSFYLFSYQVHEKQILLVIAPALLLVDEYPMTVFWLNSVGLLSMFPLLWREGLVIACISCFTIYGIIYDWCYVSRLADGWDSRSRKNASEWNWTMKVVGAGAVFLAVGGMSLLMARNPPASKPDLFVIGITAYACVHLCLIYLQLMRLGLAEVQNTQNRKSE